MRAIYNNPSFRTGIRYYRNVSITFGLFGGVSAGFDDFTSIRTSSAEVCVFCLGFVYYAVTWPAMPFYLK